MSQQKRKHWTAEEKVAILHKHLVERVAISEVCEQFQVAPVLFYRWQKEFFENGPRAFDREKQGSHEKSLQRQLAVLEARIVRKNAVIADLLENQLAMTAKMEKPCQ